MLTEGGSKLWAICLRCERRGGRSLLSGWTLVLVWIGLPILALAAVVVLLETLFR